MYNQRSTRMKPDFDSALNAHFGAIANRDIEAFKSHLSLGDTLYTVVQNGHAFETPAQTIAIHEQWFKNPNWTWKGSVIHKVVGEDMAMALVRYTYQPNRETAPFETWLTYVFQLQEALGESSTTRIQHLISMPLPVPQGSRSSLPTNSVFATYYTRK